MNGGDSLTRLQMQHYIAASWWRAGSDTTQGFPKKKHLRHYLWPLFKAYISPLGKDTGKSAANTETIL